MCNNIQYMKYDSIPRCLRHSYEGAALESAECLVSFLQDAIDGILQSSTSVESQSGLNLCFDLLRDKLAIASGNLPFPLVSDYNIEKKENSNVQSRTEK